MVFDEVMTMLNLIHLDYLWNGLYQLMKTTVKRELVSQQQIFSTAVSEDTSPQYCENDYTTKGGLQIQCYSYQITNDIFHRTRTKNFTIYIETQKTPK